MTNRNADAIQGDGVVPPPPSSGPPDQLRSRAGNTVFKSGSLFISSKGIGWTSWKKRWFILTRTSLVFFRSDPSIIPQKGSEVNLTLGGIDLNNSGSVVIKADKKLLTVLFPDGRDGRAFTLKAETMEDLYEWKDALENALTQAPSAALVMGQNGIFKNDQPEALDGSLEQLKDKQPTKSLVIGRPILLALEDVDGSPTFLEKSLKFVEEHGVKVEGILRQAADVDDVELRVREYEQGKTEFSAEEDPHVIADCVKHVLRELPSSPVPASCCNALLEACKMDCGVRVSAMRTAICETFPEPNRRLLQRILLMMQSVASNKAVNRMSSSAVAACMAPLLLRPLLAGDCELETDFDVGGDGSVQLLQAAAAANHAQAIVITLLEEYDKIFGECTALSPNIYSNSEESGSEEASDYEDSYEEGDEHDKSSHDSYSTMVDDAEHASIGSRSENGNTGYNDSYDQKEKKNLSMESIEYTLDDEVEIQKLENAKTDLQSKIAEEAKRNALLQASLEKRKAVLHTRRLALEQDVAELQEQLQREREWRRIMEAGLESPQGHIHFSATIDEKTKADIEEIAREESEITNLKQKFDDLGVKINQQHERNNGSSKDQLHLSQQTPIHHKKLGYKRDKQKETETATPSHLSQRSTRSKDDHFDEACRNNESKEEIQTLPNKHPPHTQQLDKTRYINSKSVEPLDGSSSVDLLTGKITAATNCKKPGTRGEGGNSTTSALTKLTTRLNFLKERRTQIANELQNFDKGRSSTKHTHVQEKGNGPEPHQSLQNHDKDKTPKNQQKNAELKSYPPLQNTENWAIEWDHTNKNQENHKKSDGKSSNRVLDRGRRPDGESVQNQDRVRSEGQSHNPSRTNFR